MKIVKIKPNCECGKPSVSAGYCLKCYNRNYKRKINNSIPRKKYNVDKLFNNVLIEVKKGVTIETACIICKIRRSTFYGLISETQKKELFAAKLISKLNTILI